MKHLLFIPAIIVAMLTMAACQKKDETPMQPDKVNISITSPKTGDIYRKGDTIRILASVSYISQMHGYTLAIKNKATNATLWSTEEHVHSDKFDVNNYWVNTIDSTAQLVLELAAEIDHSGNGGSSSTSFSIQP